ncbi:helicase [Lysobacter oculi]|uniref:Helicase n=1 Tax=Solilutibacter oculi TaxID=2698682 RepID=A0A344J326_9GAMM|nr:ATP-dependent DNA helicase [Lysobacter oculi]AXA83436.1 helicase [Lysobacter oculi]
MSTLRDRTREALGEAGPLASAIPGFVPRETQQRLADAIADAVIETGTLLAEAGTGTGKTYAYLVPALLSGRKTIISTGTRALQDQLYHRDLPRVREALGIGHSSALLKGRANYLCRQRMEQAKGEPKFASREHATQFQRIVAWSGRTRFGDLAELENMPEDSPVYPLVTSTNENCLGNECPFWSECFVVQARQRAQAADVVVVNHHLLLADLALKQEGFGEILPGAQTFVVDEAHQLPELAAQFFGEGLGARLLVELARDVLSASRESSGALAALQAPAQQFEHVSRYLRAAMDNLPVRGTRERALHEPAVESAFDALSDALVALIAALGPWRESGPALDAAHARAVEAEARLQRWLEAWNRDLDEEAEPLDERSPDPGRDNVYWYELTPKGFRLQRTPLDISGPLRRHREQSRAAWIFTSATLAVGGAFNHVSQRLGLWEPETRLEPGPFDWPRQALLYMPKRMPEPSEFGFNTAVVEAVLPVLRASQGRAFLLFASHRALKEAAQLLRERDDIPWPLFVQGEAPRAQLLQQFRDSGHGVLLGTASFREGVDVAGDALSVVVIDKLPFAAPDDPVFEARLDAVRRSGGNPFRDEQLPQAVIALKQGAGRLIRTIDDRGVLVLCDPRLHGKSYGRIFIDSLPPMPRTREIADVEAFFAMRDAGDDASSG